MSRESRSFLNTSLFNLPNSFLSFCLLFMFLKIYSVHINVPEYVGNRFILYLVMRFINLFFISTIHPWLLPMLKLEELFHLLIFFVSWNICFRFYSVPKDFSSVCLISIFSLEDTVPSAHCSCSRNIYSSCLQFMDRNSFFLLNMIYILFRRFSSFCSSHMFHHTYFLSTIHV